jgi:hypothetical protein
MNELILKRLAEESGFLNDVTKFEAFAALLVKECADICYDEDYTSGSGYARAIMRKFGITE